MIQTLVLDLRFDFVKPVKVQTTARKTSFLNDQGSALQQESCQHVRLENAFSRRKGPNNPDDQVPVSSLCSNGIPRKATCAVKVEATSRQTMNIPTFNAGKSMISVGTDVVAIESAVFSSVQDS